jgi:hydroxymethylpyrimidine/phosphomethylpyrimidine kinase
MIPSKDIIGQRVSANAKKIQCHVAKIAMHATTDLHEEKISLAQNYSLVPTINDPDHENALHLFVEGYKLLESSINEVIRALETRLDLLV